MKELGPRIRIRIRSERRLKTFTDLTRTSSRHRQERPGRLELAARRERVGVGGVGVWLQVGAPAPPAAQVRQARRRERYLPRAGGSLQTRAQSSCLDTLGFGVGSAGDCEHGLRRGSLSQDALSFVCQPWSTLAAGNTCEYSKSFKTYTVN